MSMISYQIKVEVEGGSASHRQQVQELLNREVQLKRDTCASRTACLACGKWCAFLGLGEEYEKEFGNGTV